MTSSKTELEKKINSQNKKHITPLKEAFDRKDFNLLFRRACSEQDTLDLAKYLYSNKEEFNIDPNGHGPSGNRALDIAIDSTSKATVLFLLMQEEVDVSDTMREKIKKNAAVSNFLANKLTKIHTEQCKKLMPMATRFSKGSQDAETKCIQLMLHVEKLTSIFESIELDIAIDEELEISTMLKLIDQINIENTNTMNFYNEFENTYSTHKPYFCAQQKLWEGPESANAHTEEMLSSYEELLVKCMEILPPHISKVNAAQSKMKLIKSLVLMTVHILASIKDEKSVIQAVPETDQSNLVQNSFFQSPEKQQELQKSNTPDQKPTMNKPTPAKPIKDSAQKERVVSQSKPKSTSSPDPIPETLRITSKKLRALKQKGEIKLQPVMKLLESLTKETNITMEKTTCGFILKSPSTITSFHRPHKKDKGVDKKAVTNVIALLDNERIRLQS
jgi:hypothetical protein